jgi:hypothetical protein
MERESRSVGAGSPDPENKIVDHLCTFKLQKLLDSHKSLVQRWVLID